MCFGNRISYRSKIGNWTLIKNLYRKQNKVSGRRWRWGLRSRVIFGINGLLSSLYHIRVKRTRGERENRNRKGNFCTDKMYKG